MIFHFISAFLHIDTNIHNNYNIKKCRNPQVSMFYKKSFCGREKTTYNSHCRLTLKLVFSYTVIIFFLFCCNLF